jgi:hypothetical protein
VDWVKLSTRYYLDPEVASLPDADTELLFVRGLAYAGAEDTGGFIPAEIVPSLIRRRRHAASVEALVARSLWIPSSGDRGQPGHLIARWQEWQEELEALERRRMSDRDRKKRERDRKAVANAEKPRRARGRPRTKPQVKNMSRDASADMSRDSHVTTPGQAAKPQVKNASRDVPSRARTDRSFNHSPGEQNDQSSVRNARAREDRDLIPVAVEEVCEREGRVISDAEALKLIAVIRSRVKKSGKRIRDPELHLRKSIANETDLYAELLDPPPPLSEILSEPIPEPDPEAHEFKPDANGFCTECPFPKANRRRHPEVRSA